MDADVVPLADRRQLLPQVVAALKDLRSVIYQCPTGQLGDFTGELAQAWAMLGASLPVVVAEAESRGVITDSQFASTTAWVADHGWHARRQASTIAKAAKLLARPELAEVADSLLTADIDAVTAVVVGAEFDKLAKDLKPDAAEPVLKQMLTMAADHGPAGVRRLVQEIIANFGDEGEFEKRQDRCRRQIDLSAGRETSPGIWDYRLRTDNEGRAVLEAALGPLSKPCPDGDGNPDPRPVGRRRGEALTEALRRSVMVTGCGRPSGSPKAVLMLTMGYEQLRAQVAAAYATGTLAAGTMLAPDTVRKLACDAAIISVVVGDDGAILEQSRHKRLFTTTQLKTLWLRDRHCSFPGCDAPAAWSDAHHLISWIDGGRTDVSNAALLCPRHHTIVHRDRLAGTVIGGRVEWDLRPGSYKPGTTTRRVNCRPPDPDNPDDPQAADPRAACQRRPLRGFATRTAARSPRPVRTCTGTTTRTIRRT